MERLRYTIPSPRTGDDLLNVVMFYRRMIKVLVRKPLSIPYLLTGMLLKDAEEEYYDWRKTYGSNTNINNAGRAEKSIRSNQ